IEPAGYAADATASATQFDPLMLALGNVQSDSDGPGRLIEIESHISRRYRFEEARPVDLLEATEPSAIVEQVAGIQGNHPPDGRFRGVSVPGYNNPPELVRPLSLVNGDGQIYECLALGAGLEFPGEHGLEVQIAESAVGLAQLLDSLIDQITAQDVSRLHVEFGSRLIVRDQPGASDGEAPQPV